MIKYGVRDISVDMYEILYLLDNLGAEESMGSSYKFYMRKYYALNFQIQDPDTPKFISSLSDEYSED